jgi:hypothetical protein
MQRTSLQSTGRTFLGFAMCGASALTIYQQSICLRAAFRAKTLARPENELVSTGTGADYGLSSPDSFAIYDLATCLWRTSQSCLFGGWEQYLATWPKSGMTRSGQAYAPLTWAPRIDGNGYSLWPTPTANMGLQSKYSIESHIKQLRRNQRDGYQTGAASGSLISRVADEFDGYPTAEFVEWLMGFPLEWTDLED